MSRTVTALFRNEQDATAAASRLEQAGIPSSDIDIWSTPHNLAPFLEDAGVSRSDAYAFVDGVVNGGCAVVASCALDKVGQVAAILNEAGALAFREQAAARSEELQKAP
jgi:hypothetical protein